jgi:hypothetical protein
MIANVAVTSAGVDLLVAPSQLSTILVTVSNISEDNNLTFSIYVVPSGQAVTSQRLVIYNRVLGQSDTGPDAFFMPEKWVLGAGDRIHIKGSADDKMVAAVSYMMV